MSNRLAQLPGCALLALVTTLPAQSPTPTLVTDLVTAAEGNAGSLPKDAVTVGTQVYFSAESRTLGRELFAYDGFSTVNTVADIWPGAASSDPVPLVGTNNRLLFSADDGVNGRELWLTSPVVRISDMNPGSGSADPTYVGKIGTTLLIRADDGINGPVLWATSGGTPVKLSNAVVHIYGRAQGDNIFYFVADDGVHGYELWKTDGTPAGTALVRDISPGSASTSFSYTSAIQDTAYFVASVVGTYDRLYISDGTSAGTQALQVGTGAYSPTRLTVVATTLLFTANDGVHGSELWRANGPNVSLAADVWPGSGSSNPHFIRYSQGTLLYFWADDGVHGPEPWTYSTATNQAQLLSDLEPGPTGTTPTGMIGDPGTGNVWAGVQHPTYGRDLWRLSTITGATRIDLNVSWPDDSGPDQFVANGSQIAFRVGSKAWFSGGTQASTVQIGTVETWMTHPRPSVPGFLLSERSSTAGSEPHVFSSSSSHWMVRDIWQPAVGATAGSWAYSTSPELHGQLLFDHSTSANGEELWRTDGTAAGTVLVKDLEPGTASSNPGGWLRYGEHVYFRTFASGSRFWRTDGTTAGTVAIPTPSGTGTWFGTSASAAMNERIVFAGQMFFNANGELYRSDGTTAGTGLLVNIGATVNSNPNQLTIAGNSLFFTADDGSGREVYKTDGTAAGTVLVKDIAPQGGSSPTTLKALGSTLFFVAQSSIFEGNELWKSDGTAAGTVMVKDIRPGPGSGAVATAGVVGSSLLFLADDGTTGTELWRTDGTVAGTWLLRDIMPGIESSSPSGFVEAFGRLYFTAESPGIGRELWESDGTVAGTHLIANIGTGAYSGDPYVFGQLGSRYLWLSATTPTAGRELFAWEPWSQVLLPMGDIRLGSGSSSPSVLGLAGAHLLMSADDGTHGRELYRLDNLASSYTFGTGCGPSGPPPGLTVTDPALGQLSTLSAYGFTPGQVSALMFGTRAFPPTFFSPGCPIYLDQQVTSVNFVSAATSFVYGIPVPVDPGLLGLSLTAQAMSLSASALDVTNGAVWTVGY